MAFEVTVIGTEELQRGLRFAPQRLAQAVKKGMSQIGKLDNEKMVAEQLSGGSGLNVHSAGFKKSFKSKVTGEHLSDLILHEYTGAKPLRIFQEGGDIEPLRSKMLTVLTPAARTAGGKRNISRADLQNMIRIGQASIVQLPGGPAIIQNEYQKLDARFTKNQSKKMPPVVLAWLRPSVHEEKRIDYFANYDSNSAVHQQIWETITDEALNGIAGEK